jgi:hypothetical protein
MSALKSLVLLLLGLVSLTACADKKAENFAQQSSQPLSQKAKIYTDEQYQNGEVALHDYVQIQGKISKTDEKDGHIKKDSRFILKTTAGNYQVINATDTSLQTGDTVTVYGEYYGFIKAMQIDSEETND